MPAPKTFRIEKPYYPIVYVRGYAMTSSEREETFNDTYYGFSASSVEKRQAPPSEDYLVADVFEGQLIRFMKIKEYGYADSVNRGLKEFYDNPSRSIWVSRFYDTDYIKDKIRSIEDHARELAKLILNVIPQRLKDCNVQSVDDDYKVILIAHSMGGLVCRTVIQNILPNEYGIDPKDKIYRLVTMGTPHKGIDMGKIPNFIESTIVSALNPFDASIFQERRMREYLKLQEETAPQEGRKFKYDLHSLGNINDEKYFPVKRCLCIIGSDYNSYSSVRHITGSFSDGLVKQDNAYIVAGTADANGKYPEDQNCFYANVHRAHSGYRGIVNSYESYESIQRFLFGDLMVRISLGDIVMNTPQKGTIDYYYDFEFSLSIRGTGIYLHRREQEPCENAIRYERSKIPQNIHLHTGFLNSRLKVTDDDAFSYFAMRFKVLEYRKEDGFLWDYKYPSRQIYSESLEIRVDDSKASENIYRIEYRWLSDMNDWKPIQPDANGISIIKLREANTIGGNVVIEASKWPAVSLTKD